MAFKPLPEQELLRQLLDYDPTSGLLIWKRRDPSMFTGRDPIFKAKRFNAQYAGKPALSCAKAGYYRGRLQGADYFAHRIVWKWWYGTDPVEIDHRNHFTLDNRIENLRDVDRLTNSQNMKIPRTNTSGCAGVVWHSRDKRWQASIRHGGKKKHLGLFTNLGDAARVRREAEVRLGFHPNHGKRFD